ncbi:hypothetical protein [Streptomyces sp. NBC_01314]|uniref:hypothetical protein n=1 Tax=Streptomyces sp. NBC_01314 TaxID=2903821 RepID=UPI00309042C6|nr:hypothetical protein OG622_22205 [Streptomyces sp. NBC_01314]
MNFREPLVVGTRSPRPARVSHASVPDITAVPEKDESPLLAGEEDRDEAESHIVRGID